MKKLSEITHRRFKGDGFNIPYLVDYDLREWAIEHIKYYQEWIEDHDVEVEESLFLIKHLMEMFELTEDDLK